MFEQTHRTVGPDVAWWALGVGLVMAVATGSLVAGRDQALAETAPTVALVTYALVLGSAAAAYVLWRLAKADEDHWKVRLSGWLVVGLTVAAVPGFVLAALQRAAEPGASQGVDGWVFANQVVVVALLVVITRVCERFDVVSDPALVGLAGGLLLTAATCLGLAAGPALRFGPDGATPAATVLVLGGLVLVWNLLQRRHVSLWVRQRLAFSAVAMVFAQSAGQLDRPGAAAAAVVANILGALVLCATILRLLRRAMWEHQEQVDRLRSTLLATEVAVHEQRDLLHELGSTLAGIASASQIIRHEHALPPPRRRRLEGMLEAEVARLVRLLSERVTPSGNTAIDLDEVLGTIVLSHQTRGTDVRWSPSGLVAAGRADDLAAVVNILLDNAARHAAGTPVTLTVTASDGLVEIACADLGPGLAPEVGARLFKSGARGPASRGQGLGLSIAKRLMDEQGGSLDLRPSAAGTTFVARLPELLLDKEMTRVVAHAS